MFIDIKLISSELSSNDVPIKSNDKNSRIVKETVPATCFQLIFWGGGAGGQQKKKWYYNQIKLFRKNTKIAI